jgi:hypothetical protein
LESLSEEAYRGKAVEEATWEDEFKKPQFTKFRLEDKSAFQGVDNVNNKNENMGPIGRQRSKSLDSLCEE